MILSCGCHGFMVRPWDGHGIGIELPGLPRDCHRTRNCDGAAMTLWLSHEMAMGLPHGIAMTLAWVS